MGCVEFNVILLFPGPGLVGLAKSVDILLPYIGVTQ